MRNLSFEAPPAVAVASNATVPNPGFLGAVLWSTLEQQTLVWNGTSWGVPRARPEPHFEEVVRVSGRVVAIINWSDATCTRKLNETNITRSSGWTKVIVETQRDVQQEVLQTLTTTIVRSNDGRVASATAVLT